MSECVYILLPVHNRCEITRKFIASLQQQTYKHYHLLLIDDGSTDGTDLMVREQIPSGQLTVLTGKGAWWWAGSLQQGIDWLKKSNVKPSDVVLMINDDVIFEEDFLGNGVAFLQQNAESLLLARFYDEGLGKIIETGVKADFRHLNFVDAKESQEINCLSTRGLFLRWNVLMKLGGFHVTLLPHYGSDYEFTMRAVKEGFTMVTVNNVVLTPDNSTTGIREYEADSFIDEIKVMFSKRCTYNPVYWTSFILLACPVRFMAFNILRVWKGAAFRLIKRLLKSISA